MDRWTNRIVLVTGASSEIGKSIVIALSKYPLKIVALARRIELLQELAEDLRSSAAKIYPVQCDLTRELEIMRVFEWIETTIGQGVSVLINNASIEIKSQILDGETKDWRNMYDVNVLALTICSRESYKSMKKFKIDDGHIININGIAGQIMLTKPGETMFNSTKTALTYLAEGLRHELSHSESKIKVTNINPGKVNTTLEGSVGNSKESILLLKPERVSSMLILALSSPIDVLIAEVTVLSVGETIQVYSSPML